MGYASIYDQSSSFIEISGNLLDYAAIGVVPADFDLNSIVIPTINGIITRVTLDVHIMQIANTASRAITQALKIIAEWEGQNPDEVKLELNTDYNLSEMDAQTITALVTAWQTGAIRQEDMFKKLQKGEIIESEISFDDFKSNLEVSSPTL